MNAIEFDHVGKQYRLGLVSTGTFSHDLNRWWTMNVRHKEDPNLKIGETNDRSQKGESNYVWALKDINFNVEQGDVVGIIGKNGAGKSTLLKLLSQVTAPTVGEIRARGRIASLLEVGTGFHPEMTGRENIYLNGAIMGMTKAEISRKLDEIIDFSGCERYIDTPVKRYSSGMTVRLGFAIAAHLEPEILVVDEVLAVGDAEFQKKAIGKMQDVSKGEGRTVLFVSHNMTAVKNLCKSGILLENGTVKFSGNVEDTINQYLAINPDMFGHAISERTDRLGNGLIRVKDVFLRNRQGAQIEEVFTGDYIRIEFNLEVEKGVDTSEMIIACSLTDSYDNSVVLWVSDEMPHDFSKLANNTLSLEIPNLNLRPNIYYLDFQISLKDTDRNNFCDTMHSAVQIHVIPEAFYMNGPVLSNIRGHQSLIPATFL